MRIGLLLSAFFVLSPPLRAQMKPRGTLYGDVVIVDPGHGGSDPGSFRMHGQDMIAENEYTYDVSLRLASIIRERGGIALLTIKDTVSVRNTPANLIFPEDHSARFAIDGSLVKAGTVGLEKRLAFGNKMSRKYGHHKQIWISIHFDVVGSDSKAEGVRIIYAHPNDRIVTALESSFAKMGRLRDGSPIVESGDKNHGMRPLFVLSSRNRISSRVLVELGNFLNDKDAYRIRDPKVREKYAKAIADALEHS